MAYFFGTQCISTDIYCDITIAWTSSAALNGWWMEWLCVTVQQCVTWRVLPDLTISYSAELPDLSTKIRPGISRIWIWDNSFFRWRNNIPVTSLFASFDEICGMAMTVECCTFFIQVTLLLSEMLRVHYWCRSAISAHIPSKQLGSWNPGYHLPGHVPDIPAAVLVVYLSRSPPGQHTTCSFFWDQ